MAGQCILQDELDDKLTEIDIRSLSQGIYAIQISRGRLDNTEKTDKGIKYFQQRFITLLHIAHDPVIALI